MKPMVILAMILSLTLGSCKKGWFDDENGPGGGNGGGGNGNGGGTPTKAMGTMVRFDCGNTIYENLWIKTDAGQLIQPCEQSFMTTCPIPLEEGDRVEVGFRKYTGSIKGFELNCKIASFPFTRAVIDFINVEKGKKSNGYVVIAPDYDQLETGGVHVISAETEGNKLVLEVGFSGCDNNTKAFELVGKPEPNNDMPTFSLKMINRNPQMCQAYFTERLFFDVSLLKNGYGKTRLKIEGIDQEIIF
jgi:hypothetical protein